jgi:hypothetical protein
LIGFLLIQHFIPTAELTAVYSEATKWIVIVCYFAGLVAMFSLIVSRSSRIIKNVGINETTLRDGVFFIAFFVFAGVYLAFGSGSSSMTWLNVIILSTISAAVTAHRAFYYLIWGYRRLRFGNMYTIMLAIGGLTWCLKEAPAFVIAFPQISEISYWVWTVPATAATRGALIASAIGAVSLGLRALVGKEPALVEAEVT